MNAVTNPAPRVAPPSNEPIPLYPGPEMAPVAFRPVEPLPPPPKQATKNAGVRAGTLIAGIGGLVAIVGLFLVPWFQVRDITVTTPPAQTTVGGTGIPSGSGQNGQGNQPQTYTGFSTRIVLRDLHDFGIVSWASARQEKRDIAIVALTLLMGAATLAAGMAHRWRFGLALAGLAGSASLVVTLIDLQRLDSFVRARLIATGSLPTLASMKVVDGVPGTGMVALLAGLGIALAGILIALVAGRRGKMLIPVS